MEFKVGDKVRVRKDLKENNYYGGARFLFGMVRLIGKIVTIEQVMENSRRYYIKEDSENWCWTDEMLEKIEYTYEDLKKAPIGTKITFENGEVLVKDDKDILENSGYVRNMLELDNFKSRILGKIIKIEEPEYSTVYESKSEILDEVEKRYLRNVIRPFRDRVKTISKFVYSGGNATIDISIDDNNTGWLIELLPFPKNEMYKGMEDNKKYTIEELGL